MKHPKPKPMTLRAEWGIHDGDAPDVVFTWGQGCHSADARLLNHIIGSKQYNTLSKEYEPSLLEELKARGYDITTLKFEIKKTALTEA